MDTLIIKPRKPFIAFLLSLLVPGLGQLYNGEMKKGLLFFILFLAILMIAGLSPLLQSFSGLLTFILVIAALVIYMLIDAVRTARQPMDFDREFYLLGYVLLLIGIAMFAVLWIVSYSFTPRIRAFTIPTVALMPTVHEGDKVIADMEAFSKDEPDYGDIVLFEQEGSSWAFRIVGLPGDSIQVSGGLLAVNGVPENRFIREKSIAGTIVREMEEKLPNGHTYRIHVLKDRPVTDTSSTGIRVPSGAYFLLGDNRDNAFDSRYIGPVERSRIRGKVIYSYSGRSMDRINIDFRNQ